MIIDLHAHIIPENFPPAGTRASAWTWPSMDHFEPGGARVMIGGENYRTVHEGNWNVERRLSDVRHQVLDTARDVRPVASADLISGRSCRRSA